MDTNSLQIRRATIEDAETLARLGAETWINTYITDKYTTGMQSYVNGIFHTHQLKKHLTDSGSLFLIAEVNHSAVGFAQMQDASLLQGVSGPDPIELERFYVEDIWLGKGVALHLMLACIAYAREYGFKTLCVSDWKNTQHARLFYHNWPRSESGWYYFTIGTYMLQQSAREAAHSLVI